MASCGMLSLVSSDRSHRDVFLCDVDQLGEFGVSYGYRKHGLYVLRDSQKEEASQAAMFSRSIFLYEYYV